MAPRLRSFTRWLTCGSTRWCSWAITPSILMKSCANSSGALVSQVEGNRFRQRLLNLPLNIAWPNIPPQAHRPDEANEDAMIHSPFPGMDPYLEVPTIWPDVHTTLMSIFREQLIPLLAPKYLAELET